MPEILSVQAILNAVYDRSTGKLRITGSGGTPGGSDTQLQYNNAGAFGGVSGVTSDGTSLIFANTALRILDSNATHELVLSTDSNLTADRILDFNTGDADRDVTINSDAIISQETALQSLTFIIDGGDSTIITGLKGFLRVPFACTINSVTLFGDQSGSIVVDIWKDTYANFPPTVADTITASAKPTITTAQKSEDTTLTGWTVAIAAGDVLAFNVDSVTSMRRVTLALKVTKS